jgi:hypothetical protein
VPKTKFKAGVPTGKTEHMRVVFLEEENLCYKRILDWQRSRPTTRSQCLNTRTTSRVTEPRIETRSANLVGETKVDCGNLLFLQMCAGVNAPRRTKSPLMAFAQPANRHDAFIRYFIAQIGGETA